MVYAGGPALTASTLETFSGLNSSCLRHRGTELLGRGSPGPSKRPPRANPLLVSRTGAIGLLHIAAAWGNDKLVDLLLDNGADINAISRFSCACAAPPDRIIALLRTPLHTLICHGHKSTARLLLSCGASTNVTTRFLGRDREHDQFTDLHSTCIADHLGAARALSTETTKLILRFNGFSRSKFQNLATQLMDDDIVEGLNYILTRFHDIISPILNEELLRHAIHTGSVGVTERYGLAPGDRGCRARAHGPQHWTFQQLGTVTVGCLQSLIDQALRYTLGAKMEAAIHSRSGKPTKFPDMRFLDVAINCRLDVVVVDIMQHPKYGSPTNEEVSRHWQTIINNPWTLNPADSIIDPGRSDLN
ncbi:hypothetical protein F5Y09DRAFT_346896 [Xylaria sp. FL1042]|nr:hypothetical protein F5Y09DRAFT_346896 [Xylaria sp. FL1042]